MATMKKVKEEECASQGTEVLSTIVPRKLLNKEFSGNFEGFLVVIQLVFSRMCVAYLNASKTPCHIPHLVGRHRTYITLPKYITKVMLLK